MTTRIFHLVTQQEWLAGQREGRYTPARFEADGFVHATGDLATTVLVADAYFSKVTEPVVVLEVDVEALDVPLKWEAPVSVDGRAHAHHAVKAFPHVYGSIPLRAVVAVHALNDVRAREKTK